MRESRGAALAWGLVLLLPCALLRTVARAPAGLIPAPYEGVDPLFQAGLLEWSARHWWQPAVWASPPFFYPASGAIAYMDGLLGQALLVWPAHLLAAPPALLYNLAVLGSLWLAAGAFAFLWRSGGGGWMGAACGALALLSAPYTLSQCGHLNQLPPAAAVASVAALLVAWRRAEGSGGGAAPGTPAASAMAAGAGPGDAAAWGAPAAAGGGAAWWWLAGACLTAQAAWGWYGFGYAVVAGLVVSGHGAWRCARAGRMRRVWGAMLPPLLVTAAAVLVLAWPWLRAGARETDFRRTAPEVRALSADLGDLLVTTPYRGLAAGDRAVAPAGGAQPWRRRTLNPGWIALGAAAWGWAQRRRLAGPRRRDGAVLLAVGLAGLVLAFGDSVGLPGGDRRLPLPFAWLQAVCPPFRAFRAAWRFGFLFTLAAAWWAAVGCEARPAGGRAVRAGWPLLLLAALACEGWPARLPVERLEPLPAPGVTAGGPCAAPPGALLTLPAPAVEGLEDRVEARWLLRALARGRPVTGGVSGWVPPVTRELRRGLRACEQGWGNADSLLAAWREAGVGSIELATDAADPASPWRAGAVAYWERALRERRWRPCPAAPGYVLYLPPAP